VVGVAMRRRAKTLAGEENDIGDIAHLEAHPQYFAFCSPSQQVFSLLIRYRSFPLSARGSSVRLSMSPNCLSRLYRVFFRGLIVV
jgi:hypothetical protein